jgi:hypothetical protein
MKEAQDIDELEAMLAGLDQDDLDSLASLDEPAPAKSKPVIDDDISEADLAGLDGLLEEEPAPTAAKPTRKRNLKPLTATPAKVPTLTSEQLEELATKVVDLITELAAEYKVDDSEIVAVVQPALDKIDDRSDWPAVKVEMSDLAAAKFKVIDDEPFTEETVKPQLDEEPLIPFDVDTTIGTVSIKDAEVTGENDDAELEALLATVSAPAPVAGPTTPPVGRAGSAPKVTPTTKSGALNTFIDADKLQEDLHFTETSINMAMTRQAALFAHYARLSADATYQADRAKQQVELLEAQLNQRFRDSMVAAGTKFTEKSIDAMVISDSSYQAAQERAHEAKAIASMVASAADSFRHRKDMLIQVGADLRLEKQGELRMKEHPGQRALDNMEK